MQIWVRVVCAQACAMADFTWANLLRAWWVCGATKDLVRTLCTYSHKYGPSIPHRRLQVEVVEHHVQGLGWRHRHHLLGRSRRHLRRAPLPAAGQPVAAEGQLAGGALPTAGQPVAGERDLGDASAKKSSLMLRHT